MPTIKIELTDDELDAFMNDEDIKAALGNKRYTVTGASRKPNQMTIFQIFDVQIRMFRTQGNYRSAETYTATLRSIKRFRNGRDISPSQVTPQLLEAYQCHLRSRNLTMNSVSFYMRIFRAVYNRAVDQGLTADIRPFRRVYTGIAKTVKRALPLKTIKAIKNLKTNAWRLQFARDMFMFSFYTRGMSFIDMANLTTANIRNGVLTYKRRKTGQPLSVRWEPRMQEIVDRYEPIGDYLLPIIANDRTSVRSQYRTRQTLVNQGLKEISELLKLDSKFSMYAARHSWASIASSMRIPIDVISRGMGHTSEKTTQIYLKSIETNTLDKANSKIIDSR